LVGKGPTFARHAEVRLDDYHVLALNQAGVHIDCALVRLQRHRGLRRLRAGSQGQRPQDRGHAPGTRTRACTQAADNLLQWSLRYPDLNTLRLAGRLCSYNSTPRAAQLPADRLADHRRSLTLAPCRVQPAGGGRRQDRRLARRRRGTAYAQPFDEKDRLANGQPTFDVQFHAIASTAKLHGIKYRQLFPGVGDAAGLVSVRGEPPCRLAPDGLLAGVGGRLLQRSIR